MDTAKYDCTRRDFLRATALGAATLFLPRVPFAAETNRREPFTFVQLCDTQLGFGGYDHDVKSFKQAVQQINEIKPDFALICGDLVNDPKKTSFAAFNNIKAGFTMPCYCAPGNHDLGSLSNYRKAVGEDYYSFEHKEHTFVIVNTQLWKAPLKGESSKHNSWFNATLETAAHNGSRIFVVGHHPLFIKNPDEDEGYYNLPVAKRRELLPLFETRGVVAMLTGHTHLLLINEYKGIQLVSGETTSVNFDERPLGFRLWQVGGPRPFMHTLVPLEGF